MDDAVAEALAQIAGKRLRGRVSDDRRTITLDEPLPLALAGREVLVAITWEPGGGEIPARDTNPPTPAMWPDMRLLGPFRRADLYDEYLDRKLAGLPRPDAEDDGGKGPSR